MGWGEFTAFIEAMNRQNTPPEQDVGSWKGTENDRWWVEERRKRDEMQERARGR